MTFREHLITVHDQHLDNRSYARASRGDYGSNRLYDQQGILLRYMGLNPDMWLPVKVQHGWGEETAGEFFSRETILENENPVLSWSDRFYNNLLKYAVKSIRIGAPVLYAGIDVSWISPDKDSCIYFPAHGCDEVEITNYESLKSLRSEVKASRITICLHHHDYNEARVKLLNGFGYDCTTVGGNFRHGFFWRCLALIAAHGFVAANAVGTTSFFAGLADRPFVLAGKDPEYNVDWTVYGREWTKEHFPEFMTLANYAHKEITEEELGCKHLKSPSELRKAICNTSQYWNEEELNDLSMWIR